MENHLECSSKGQPESIERMLKWFAELCFENIAVLGLETGSNQLMLNHHCNLENNLTNIFNVNRVCYLAAMRVWMNRHSNSTC